MEINFADSLKLSMFNLYLSISMIKNNNFNIISILDQYYNFW